MAEQFSQLPERIARELSRCVPTNCTIFYHPELGWVYQEPTSDLSDSTSEVEESPIESLGPFGTVPADIALSLDRTGESTFQIQTSEKLMFLHETLPLGILCEHAPITPVTLPEDARRVANIPEDATHFCWVYPPIGFTELSDKKKEKISRRLKKKDPEYTFLALGGFFYLELRNRRYQLLQANCLVKADTGLIFDGPYQWKHEYTKDLARQGRFQDVTIGELLELGIKYYCFVNPGELLKSSHPRGVDWQATRNGGFVYLYDAKRNPHPYDCFFAVADQSLSDDTSSGIMPFSLIRNRPTSSINRNENRLLPHNEEYERYKCIVCVHRDISCLFIPCKHLCTCNECAERIRGELQSKCPLCRREFSEIWSVFS